MHKTLERIPRAACQKSFQGGQGEAGHDRCEAGRAGGGRNSGHTVILFIFFLVCGNKYELR